MKTIALTQGKFALVDDEDFERVNQFRWHYAEDKKAGKPGYAKRRGARIGLWIWMHKFVIGVESGQVDHRDGNRLNCQKSNLRPATHSQNCFNRQYEPKRNASGAKGVTWVGRVKKWRVQIKKNRKSHWGGYFSSWAEAVKTYDRMAVRMFGEFARTNQSMGIISCGDS